MLNLLAYALLQLALLFGTPAADQSGAASATTVSATSTGTPPPTTPPTPVIGNEGWDND